MGRDWTPAEHYMVEQRHIKEGRGDLFDFLENLKFVYDDGKEEILNPPEEMAIRRQFPVLGRLLMDDFPMLYDRLSKIEDGLEFLHKKDEELSVLIKSMESRTGEYNKDSYLYKWFVGKLDDHFYYGERNNELFVECILEDAMALNRESYDKERFEAALQSNSLDVDMEANRDFFETHANKLIYVVENHKDLLDFDFWCRYELLLGEKITWDEYVAIDSDFDGDPHDVEFSHKKTINKFKSDLSCYREDKSRQSSLDENIKVAERNRGEPLVSGDSSRGEVER